jgi:hypothetical protein
VPDKTRGLLGPAGQSDPTVNLSVFRGHPSRTALTSAVEAEVVFLQGRSSLCTPRGIVLLALGLKKTIADVEEPLKLVPATALLGGIALYLLAHVAFRLRNLRTLNTQRLVIALLLLALLPAAVEFPALATVGIASALLAVLVAYEAIRFAEARDRVRHQLARGLAPGD